MLIYNEQGGGRQKLVIPDLDNQNVFFILVEAFTYFHLLFFRLKRKLNGLVKKHGIIIQQQVTTRKIS